MTKLHVGKMNKILPVTQETSFKIIRFIFYRFYFVIHKVGNCNIFALLKFENK